MAILITGATGFLGSHLARKLVERGERVKILLRKTSKTLNIDDIDAERVYGDVLDIDSIRNALKDCDRLFHVAGLVSTKKADYKKMEEININGTVNVLTAALDAGVEKVVYTSTIGAVGVEPGGGIGNEDTSYNLEPYGVQYLNSKHYAELEALKFVEKGLPLVIVNPAMVMGPGDIYLTSTGAFIVWYCKKKFPGYIDGGGLSQQILKLLILRSAWNLNTVFQMVQNYRKYLHYQYRLPVLHLQHLWYLYKRPSLLRHPKPR